MENKKQDKIAWALIIIALAMGVCAVILFTIYKDTNALINSFATILLELACIVIFYLKFYWNIKPFWVGIILALILFLAFFVVSLVVHHFFKNTGNLIGIPIVFALAIILHYFEKPISNVLISIFKRREEK